VVSIYAVIEAIIAQYQGRDQAAMPAERDDGVAPAEEG